MPASHKPYRLGLDLGTNSIGWAAIELDGGNNPCGLLDMGVRIFPDGRDARGEASNAVERRVARGQRRRRDRYLSRRERLMQTLVEYGLMPEDAAERKGLESLDPYTLRARALDKPLPPYELGRALFHLDQRRGFKSNRKAGGDEKEDGQVRTAINELHQRIEESGARTLGEYLAWRHKRGDAVRARPETGLRADRAMYEKEFDRIRAAQQNHHNLDDNQWEILRGVIFHQRDLRPVEPGWCQFEFENRERRAAKALPVFQEFRLLQEVNNLRVRVGNEPERPLSASERKYALERLREGKDINLNKPTGLLKSLTFNLAAGGRKAIKGDETAARLDKPARFGKRWPDSLDERNEIVRFLLNTEDPEVVGQKAVDEWGLNDEQAAAVANVSLPPGYGNLSEKAIRKILPHLSEGLVFSDAVKEAGYEHHSDFRNAEAHDELPYYGVALPRDAIGADPTKDAKRDGEPAVHGRIANPTVHIGLNQLRRVVNQLTKTYGKPQEIVVELARELKMNREDKQNYQRQQRAGAERNRRFREQLESAEIDVTPDALRKLRLWEEQGPPQNRVCPYTGRTLSFELVMSAQTDVDHILPFSRTLDNSPANLVVCMADANRVKGNRTPYEAFGDGCLEYVKDLPANKRWRFQENAMERFEGERDFLDRQLNETQYLSRTARTYLAYLYDEQGEHRQRVRVIPGRMTALLRRGWGLEGMLRETADGEMPRKTRDDHRHHAVDAFVVANTTQGLLKQFADAAGSGYQDAEENLARFAPKPWEPWEESGRNEVKRKLDEIVVSHRPDHGKRGEKGQTTGQLHNETAYGIVNLVEDGPSEVVHRKNLSEFKKRDDLTSNKVRIRDEKLREALVELWDKVAAEGGKPADFVERAWNPGVLVNGRGRRQQVRSVRVFEQQTVTPIEDCGGRLYKAYKTDGNEFADAWQMRDGNWRIVIVSTFRANQPDFNIEDFRPVTTRGKHKGKPDPAAKWLMRLYKGDLGALYDGDNRRIVRVRQFSKGTVVLDDHNEANVDWRERHKEIKRNHGHSATTLREQGFRKVRVDEIGRVKDPGPFKS